LVHYCFQICHPSKLEDLVDHVLTTGSAHDNLSVLSIGELGISFRLVHLVVVLSLSIDSRQVLLLRSTLLLKGHVLCLDVGELGVLVDAHDLYLSFRVDCEGLCLRLSLVDLLDGLSLNLLDNDIAITLSVDNLLIGISFGAGKHLLVDCLRLLLSLSLLNNCTLDLFLQQVVLSTILVLQKGQLLLFFVFEGEFQVLLLLLMILEFNLQPCLFGEGADELGVHEDTCDIALLEGDAVLEELLVQLLHHVLSHI